MSAWKDSRKVGIDTWWGNRGLATHKGSDSMLGYAIKATDETLVTWPRTVG